MSDDELDRHLRDVLASVIPPSASLSETFEKLLAARDRLRLAIDAAVRAERIRIVEALRGIQQNYTTNRPQEWSAINCAIAAIRSNT